MKKIGGIICLLVLLSNITHAEVNIGGNMVWRGTIIEIAGPHPSLDIQAIIDGITDASSTMPYVIKLGPGKYDLGTNRIEMKEWVSIQGWGQESTKVTGEMGSSYGIVVGANNAGLTDLTVENRGGGIFSIAIYNVAASPRIARVNAIALSGIYTYAIFNANSSPAMLNITASASGGSENNYGILNNDSSSPSMESVTASGVGGTQSCGVFNDASFPVMTNVKATGSGGSERIYGVYNANFSAPFIQHSVLEREGTGSLQNAGLFIHSDSPNSHVVNSKIIGGVFTPAGTQCRGNYDGNLADVGC